MALGDSIYLWNASDGGIQQLMQTQGEQSHVTSLAWIGTGNYMAVGTSDHKVQLWDVDKLRQVRSMTGHRARVSSLSWNGPCLSSGSRDSMIYHHDVRAPEHKVGCLKGHAQEVCGLKWSPSGQQLASGGNDNILNVWDDRCAPPRLSPPASRAGAATGAAASTVTGERRVWLRMAYGSCATSGPCDTCRGGRGRAHGAVHLPAILLLLLHRQLLARALRRTTHTRKDRHLC